MQKENSEADTALSCSGDRRTWKWSFSLADSLFSLSMETDLFTDLIWIASGHKNKNLTIEITTLHNADF